MSNGGPGRQEAKDAPRATTARGDQAASTAVNVLGELETLLREEQKAVAAYDVAALERIGAAKEDAASRLATATLTGNPVAFRHAATRVAALAQANAAMLAAAVSAVNDALGVRPAVTTYDSRARLQQRMSSASVRVV